MTQKQRVISMLRAAGEEGVTTSTFLEAMIPRFSARIEELREEGHTISSQRLSSGSWRYVLSEDDAARDRETLDREWAENDARLDEGGLFDASDYNRRPRGPYDYD